MKSDTKTKIDPKIKKLWVDALKSGKYKQHFDKRCYRSKNGYSAVGVLLKVHEMPSLKEVPAGVLHKIEFMNDEEQKSFTEIAKFITATY